MVGHLTVGIGPTETWAGINTVKVPALLASWTVRVDDTLRSAGNIRVSEVVRDAAAGTSRTSLGTDSIASTGRRIAGIDYFRDRSRCCDSVTGGEGVSGVSWVTATCWSVIVDTAGGVSSTHSRAGINTFLSDTGFIHRTFKVDSAFWLAFNIWISK